VPRNEVSIPPSTDLLSDVRVLQTQLEALRNEVNHRFDGQDRNVGLALTAAEKTTAIAQQTADRAVVKAEAAASREYLEAQINAAKEALTAALASSEKAITKAEEANEKRFQSVNEFRQTLADQQTEFATKSEVNFRFSAIDDKLHTALTTLSENRGKSQGANWLWGVLLAAAGIMLTVASVVGILLTRR